MGQRFWWRHSEFVTFVRAASLGQVYKGKLRSNGAAVAVKVQRPYVLETVRSQPEGRVCLLEAFGLHRTKLSWWAKHSQKGLLYSNCCLQANGNFIQRT